MNPEQLFQQLKDLAEKLDIKISEQNFKATGIHVKSGFCKVNGQQRFIIDKHLPISKKNQVLAAFLGQLPIDTIFVVPKVREYIASQNLKFT
ncbi:MAG: hypothetical protein RBT11_03820 [Desulfobacterales bacterium]|jgi:hypothetical protein|nr:hypothetical protein [Desulfobacterales bacterium]